MATRTYPYRQCITRQLNVYLYIRIDERDDDEKPRSRVKKFYARFLPLLRLDKWFNWVHFLIVVQYIHHHAYSLTRPLSVSSFLFVFFSLF